MLYCFQIPVEYSLTFFIPYDSMGSAGHRAVLVHRCNIKYLQQEQVTLHSGNTFGGE
jgi:hypothetical protein